MLDDLMRLQRTTHAHGATSAGTQNMIVFQGEMGANSQVACQQAYPDHRPAPCPTFEDAFATVASGAADLAMIPIENSVAGRVPDIHYLMPGAGLNIVAEWFLPVRHQLMAPKGADLHGIKSIQSHGMALGQCRKIIRRLGAKPVVAADTAGSAREVAQGGDMTRAAIAPRLAAELYGLDILAEDVEDEPHNTTRFIVLAHRHGWPQWREGPVITTLVFRVRNVPAALYKALGGLASNGVNMTKLESYMLEGDFCATQFYCDIEGHPGDRSVRLALEELAFFSKELKILGVYPAHPFRSARKMDRPSEPGLLDENASEFIFARSCHDHDTATRLDALRGRTAGG
jgi:prephenate dehydratase